MLTFGCALYWLLEVGDDCQKWNARVVICLGKHLASRESCSPHADAAVSAASAAAAATCHWSGIGLNALHNLHVEKSYLDSKWNILRFQCFIWVLVLTGCENAPIFTRHWEVEILMVVYNVYCVLSNHRSDYMSRSPFCYCPAFMTTTMTHVKNVQNTISSYFVTPPCTLHHNLSIYSVLYKFIGYSIGKNL